MKNFSDENVNDLVTNKDRTIQQVRSLTGLPIDHITKIYESQKIDDVSDEAIIDNFSNLVKPKMTINLKDFFGSFVNGLSGVELTDGSKTEVTKAILSALHDYSTGKVKEVQLDSVQLLSIVTELIAIKNPASKEYFSKFDSTLVLGTADTEFSSLSESINFSLPENEIKNSVMLFEGLREILAKNNKRWGNSYHIQNTYEACMSYFDQELENLKLKESMISVDNSFHLELINDILSGKMNPIYAHVNGVKGLVPDLQTLVFDMVLILHNFINQNKWNLNYIARQTVNDYESSARNLIACIASSRVVSKILHDEIRLPNAAVKTDERDSPLCYANADSEWGKKNFLRLFADGINSTKFDFDYYDMPLKAALDMTKLIKSTSSEFNLKIRPYLQKYVTKMFELISKVEKARLERNKNSRY